MRHRLLGRRLGRNSAQRKALRRNMVADLIAHEQVITTEAKARMLRPVAEKMITLAKRGLAKGPEGGVHARRLAAARLAHVIHSAGHQLHSAHIATYGERAVDVFYLTRADGKKLRQEEGDQLRSALLSVAATGE